jgi:Tol biopolymer transport system component
MSASCTGQPAAHEALIVMQGSPAIVLADVTDATHPQKLCTLSGGWSPELVTQRMISWSATQTPGQAGPSMLVTLDMFAGTTTVVARWQGGSFMDGLHSWSPDESSIAYVTSDASAVNLHLLSGGGDRSVATLGAVPGRGVNSAEDDSFLGFSADGTYFALVQTFTGSGSELQVRRTKDGTLAYSQATGTMATWSSTGSRLYFREPGKTAIEQWDPSAGVSQLIGLAQSWLRPVSDAGDDNVAYTVRDTSGIPHVWIYGHGGRSGGQLGNVRSSPLFLNAGSLFLVEEAPCGANCGLGPQTSPDGKTFVYNLGTQAETPSTITSALGSWPRIGQT